MAAITEQPQSDGSRQIQIWDLWYPDAAAQGLSFARGRLKATDVLLVHAAPDRLDVAVRDDCGRPLAAAKGLPRTADTPMLRLVRKGDAITREDIWPGADDLNQPVLLPGGEVGTLIAWWNNPDGSEWRWQVEFYNHR
jgi:hypothetical protein